MKYYTVNNNYFLKYNCKSYKLLLINDWIWYFLNVAYFQGLYMAINKKTLLKILFPGIILRLYISRTKLNKGNLCFRDEGCQVRCPSPGGMPASCVDNSCCRNRAKSTYDNPAIDIDIKTQVLKIAKTFKLFIWGGGYKFKI